MVYIDVFTEHVILNHINNKKRSQMSKAITPKYIIDLYRTTKTKTSLLRDEANGLIPKASRENRGENKVRVWHTKDLPKIGSLYGLLKKPESCKVIAIYTAKGGVLKTTLAYNLARYLALNNISVLVIGMDVQCSVTDLLSSTTEKDISSLDDIIEMPGLYEFTCDNQQTKESLQKYILTTDLSTLNYIPENISLNLLDQKIRDSQKREFFIDRIISPLKKDYDVIIFDNAPNWSFLIQNSLVAATDVISPVGCDIGTYRSINQNIGMINSYKENMELNWGSYTIVPTLLERTNISKNMEAKYRVDYSPIITSSSIRRAVKGQESVLENVSVIETDPSSSLASDYFDVISSIWQKINGEI